MTTRHAMFVVGRLAALAGLLALIVLVAALGGVALACCIDQLIGS